MWYARVCMQVLAYASVWLCRYVSMCSVCSCALLLPSVPHSLLPLCICAGEPLEARTGSSKPSVGSWHLSPLHLHFISQAAVGAELLAASAHSPPSLGGCLTLGYSRDMCERSSYFYPALTGCDGSVEEGLSAVQGY